MALKIKTTPTFAKVVKKLHDKDKKTVDDAVREILAKPTIGEAKKGDLLGVSVYKFKINKQEILLSYSVHAWSLPRLAAAPSRPPLA